MTTGKYHSFWIFTTIAVLSIWEGLFGVGKVFAASASYYISPASGSYTVGDTITASLMIDSGGQAINAGEGSVSYPTDTLEFQSVSTSGSIFNFWTSGPISSNTSASFGGGLSNPGYSGAAGKILTITWKAKSTGSATISVFGSKILANDGVGTNVYGSSSGASFIIDVTTSTTAPITEPTVKKPATSITVSSITHPDQKKWYAVKDVTVSWKGGSDINGYKFSFDQNSSGDPSSSATSSLTKTNYNGTADGVWYFHIRGITATSTTGITHFKVQLDTTPPDAFEVTTTRKGGSTDPSPAVTFEAKDASSGIDRYEVKLNSDQWTVIKSGDRLPKQRPGGYTLTIRAIDKAGNTRESSARYNIEGIAPLTILAWDRVVSLLTPVKFTGRSLPDDTIFIYLNSKEVDHFLAKDKQISNNDVLYRKYAMAGSANEIIWKYEYDKPLYPGTYAFQFSRTDASGAESALVNALNIIINGSEIRLGQYNINTTYVIIALVLVSLILLLILGLLAIAFHRVAKRYATLLFGEKKKVHDVLAEVEKNIDQVIRNDLKINDQNLPKIADKMDQDVHKVIDQAEKKIK